MGEILEGTGVKFAAVPLEWQFESRAAKKAAEFAAGRMAAFEALGKAGYSGRQLIPRGEKGEPIFPPGYAGSISHTRELACAVAVRKSDHLSVGIDVEMAGKPISPDAAEFVMNGDEFWLTDAGLNCEPETLVFSAKESIFKALFPLVRVKFSFDAVSIVSVEPDGELQARLNIDLNGDWGAGRTIGGYWVCEGRYVYTVCVLG